MTLPPLPGDPQPNQPTPETGGWPDSSPPPPPDAGGWPDAQQPGYAEQTGPGTGDWQQQQPVGAPGWPQQPPPPQAPGWQPGPAMPAPGGGKSNVWLFVVFGAVMVLLIGAGVWIGIAMLGNDEDRAKDTTASGAKEPGAKVDDGGISLGGGGTRVDVFVDFGCPACASFHQENGETLAKAANDGKATVVFHAMTFLDPQFTDEYSSRAANASVCAADEDKYFEYTKLLFTNQPAEGGEGLSDDQLIGYGTDVGVGADFADCVTDKTYADWVKKVEDKSISATPTIRIDGKDVDAASFAGEFDAAIG